METRIGNGNEHSLVRMRDAETAIQILTRDDANKPVSLCICCINHQTPLCKKEFFGVCSGYVLDERNPHQTELRVMAFLQGHPHS